MLAAYVGNEYAMNFASHIDHPGLVRCGGIRRDLKHDRLSELRRTRIRQQLFFIRGLNSDGFAISHEFNKEKAHALIRLEVADPHDHRNGVPLFGYVGLHRKRELLCGEATTAAREEWALNIDYRPRDSQ